MLKHKVLDGGLATQLAGYGHNVDGDPLWSARLIATSPDVLQTVHISFLEAGADIIETATYQASVAGFTQHLSVSCDEAMSLMSHAVDLCTTARDIYWEQNHTDRHKPLVAGSVGPYGACLCDGSEYNGTYVDSMSVEELMDWHRPRLQALCQAGADIIALETIPAQKEAEALVKLLRELPDCKAWLSFSCKDGASTCHGDPVSSAVQTAMLSHQVVGVGFNCTAPWYITSLLQHVPDNVKHNKTVIVYPNSGETWTRANTWEGEVSRIHTSVSQWMSLGAGCIGGCCRITPDDVTEIRTAMHDYLTSHHLSDSI